MLSRKPLACGLVPLLTVLAFGLPACAWQNVDTSGSRSPRTPPEAAAFLNDYMKEREIDLRVGEEQVGTAEGSDGAREFRNSRLYIGYDVGPQKLALHKKRPVLDGIYEVMETSSPAVRDWTEEDGLTVVDVVQAFLAVGVDYRN